MKSDYSKTKNILEERLRREFNSFYVGENHIRATSITGIYTDFMSQWTPDDTVRYNSYVFDKQNLEIKVNKYFDIHPNLESSCTLHDTMEDISRVIAYLSGTFLSLGLPASLTGGIVTGMWYLSNYVHGMENGPIAPDMIFIWKATAITLPSFLLGYSIDTWRPIRSPMKRIKFRYEMWKNNKMAKKYNS